MRTCLVTLLYLLCIAADGYAQTLDKGNNAPAARANSVSNATVQGDVNSDGTVSLADLPTLIDIVLGKGGDVCISDVDGDGIWDLWDIGLLSDILLGKPAYVDLGLTSGTLWATCNVGASQPEGYGDYFAWGETTPKDEYTLENYIEPTAQGYDMLDLACDAAYVNWGDKWCMPTWEQMEELMNECAWTWTQQNGADGYRVEGPNGNSIFLPAAGKAGYPGGSGSYWNNLRYDESFAQALYFNVNDFQNALICKEHGCSARPVRRPFVRSISLSDSCLALASGDICQLTATVVPASLASAVQWSSSDTLVATVSASGLVTALSDGSCTIACTATNDDGFTTLCQVTVESEYIDLGLPSGTLWAPRNLGASSPNEYGDRYAWGETAPKETYTSDNYAFYSSSMTQYNDTDSLTQLMPCHDAAQANWGYGWRTPTQEQMEELLNIEYTTTSYVEVNDVHCMKVTSRVAGYTDRYIVLPVTGNRSGSTVVNSNLIGYYASRTLSASSVAQCSALSFICFSQKITSDEVGSIRRILGIPVRPVRELPVRSVTLYHTALTLTPSATAQLTAATLPSMATSAALV